MKTTTGIFKNYNNAENLITELGALGLGKDDISYIYLNKSNEAVIEGEMAEKHPVENSANEGAKTGLIVGAVTGLIVAAGILPGLGALFVAGPLAVALGLTGAVATTAAGAMTGAAAGGDYSVDW